MQKLVLLLSICVLFSCGNEVSEKLIVKGTVKGLKKGSIYLKKTNDTTLTIIDSMVVSGDSNFKLESPIESPELFYLSLHKGNGKDRISFFGDKGVTEINTTLKRFVYDAKIKGSKQQETYEKYLSMASKFSDKNLALIQENFNAIKSNDTALLNETVKSSKSLERRKYLYTVNFAINNNDSEVAPYLALTELYNANVKYLDMVNDTLTPKVKASYYGKELQRFVDKIKLQEQE